MCRLSADFDDAHHSFVFVVEDVAVVDGASGKVVEEDPHCDVAVGGYVDDVLPGWLFDQLPFLDDLHRPNMKVDRVIHRRGVCDRPLLDRAAPDGLVDPFGSNPYRRS